MANPNEDRARDIAARGGQDQYEFETFKAMTGRSDTNPYGDAGRFGSNADYSGIMSAQQINDVNRMAFEQAKGLQSGRGFQGRGMSAPQQGYAPALKIGERIPGGTVAAANPEASGLGSFLRDGGFLGALLGGGNRPRKFVPVGSGGDALGAVDYNTVSQFPETTRSTRPVTESNLAGAERIALSRPIKEIGGGFGDNVPIMEQIANPGGQAYEAPVADMVNMTLPTPPPENLAEMVSTRDTVDNVIASVGQALDGDYSPSPAAVTRENIMDAILANQIRNRNARNVENLVSAAVADSLANQEDMAEKARRMAEINNPPGDPLIELPAGTDPIDDFDMLTLGTTPLPTTSYDANEMMRINQPIANPASPAPVDAVNYDTIPLSEFIGETVGAEVPLALAAPYLMPPAPVTTVTPTSLFREVTVAEGDERARLIGEERTRQEIENQLVSQGVSRPQARMRANKAVYGFGDATPRTSMAIGRGADPMAAAFEAGLPPLR